MNFVPTRVYFAQGTFNNRKENKNTRDRVSVLLGISRLNISALTSVIPPDCREISKEELLTSTREGEIVFAINGVCESNVPGTIVTAGMGIVRPVDDSCGFVTELYEELGIHPELMQERIEKSAIQIMGDQIAGDFSEDETNKLWRRGQTEYEINGVRFTVRNMIASTVVPYTAQYAAAFVLAVLLP